MGRVLMKALALRLRFRLFLGPLIERSDDPLRYYLEKIRDTVVEAPDHIVLQAIENHGSIEAFVYDRVAFLANEELCSGDHHLCRGVLDPDGDGQEILAIYDHCAGELEKIGAVTHQQADYMKLSVRDAIMCVG